MTNFSTVFRLAPISLLLFVVTACSLTGQAKNHEEATRDVISDGLVLFKPLSRLGSGEPLAVFGLPVMGQTNFVSAEALCEGAAGSVLPPLAFKQCSTGVVMSPFRVLESALGPLGGRTISLPGLERFWVSQKKDNLCWAAAIEIVRGYLHLSHVTHLTMPATVAKECPKLLNQTKGAELFQIAFVISKFNRLYDNSRLAPHACSTEQCVIESIQRGRPVIALKSAHAVVIQAVEIADGAPDAIWRYKILDPAGDGKIETRESLEMCTADAFIAF